MAEGDALHGLTVLVVEDEIFIALELERILDTAGCHVLGPVATVADALALLENGKPGGGASRRSVAQRYDHARGRETAGAGDTVCPGQRLYWPRARQAGSRKGAARRQAGKSALVARRFDEGRAGIQWIGNGSRPALTGLVQAQ